MNFDEYKKAVNKPGMTVGELDDLLTSLPTRVLEDLFAIYTMAAGSIGIDQRQSFIAHMIKSVIFHRGAHS